MTCLTATNQRECRYEAGKLTGIRVMQAPEGKLRSIEVVFSQEKQLFVNGQV